jgi:hypothetical protein
MASPSRRLQDCEAGVETEKDNRSSFSASTPDTVPGDLAQVEFIVKDSKRFSDTHGWGYAMFDYDAASGTFAPATKASKPPVNHDARCGAACHELAASKDYIFTAYPKR